MRRLVALCLLAPLLAGCPQGSTREVINNGLSGAVSGFVSGGPVGAIVGGIGAVLATIGGGVAVNERRTRARRERIIDHYRRNAGDLDPLVLSKVKEGVTIFPLTGASAV